MARALAGLGLLAAAALAGCPASNSIYGSHTAANTGGRSAGAGAGTTASGTTGGATTAGSSTGGSTGTTGFIDAGCGSLPPLNETPLTDCPPSQVEVLMAATQTCNLETYTPAAGFQLTDLNDPTLIENLDACGRGDFCVAPGTPVTPQLSSPGYGDVILATLLPEESARTPPMELACVTLLESFADLGTAEGLDATKAAVVVALTAVNNDLSENGEDYPDAGCYDHSGWQFQLLDVDGGSVPDAAPFYLAGLGGMTATDATGPTGLAYYFNVDPALGSVQVSATRDGNQLSDGGERCASVSGLRGFTGQIPIRAGYTSIYPYLVRPADPSAYPVVGEACSDPGDLCLGTANLYCDGTCCGAPDFPCTSDADCCATCSGPDGGPPGDGGACT